MNKVKHSILLGLIMLLSLNPASAFSSETILINHPNSPSDSRYQYPKNLLQRILTVTQAEYGDFTLETSGISMTRTRALRAMIEGKNLHVMAEAPKPDWNEKLLAVRIPIRKGIQGYRLFLTKNEHINSLNQVADFETFKKLPTGSGEQWSTTLVLEEAGFNVVKGVDYEGLFGMLMRNRFMTFGRGVNEVFMEYEQRKANYSDLHIDERFALYIPLPTYYFVSPAHPVLRDRIETGLTALIDSGEFEKLFKQEFGEVIIKSKLDKRIMFSINNPNLIKDDPIHIKKYWHSP